MREAAISFGASKWYLLIKVDLPSPHRQFWLVYQTIMLSLAMAVVASLIGAKARRGCSEALQYANVGQGILAGFGYSLLRLMLDRIVQGRSCDHRGSYVTGRYAMVTRWPLAATGRTSTRCPSGRQPVDRTYSPRHIHDWAQPAECRYSAAAFSEVQKPCSSAIL